MKYHIWENWWSAQDWAFVNKTENTVKEKPAFHEGVKFLCSDKGAYQDIEEQQMGSSPFVLSIQHPFQSSYGWW